MTGQRTAARATLWIAAMGLPLAAVAFALRGVPGAVGAVAGTALAVGNWLALRWLVAQMLGVAPTARRAGVALFLKTALLCTVAAAMAPFVDRIGFSVGLSALVLGALAGAVHGHLLGETRGDGPALPIGMED